VRPVNLIPLDQRRGSARGASRRSGLPVYIALGALGAGVLCVLALVLASNQINEKTTKVAELQTKEAGAKSVADSLRPYGQFATVATARQTQIEQVVRGRFDWDHVIDQLSRTTPSNVWLLTVSGTFVYLATFSAMARLLTYGSTCAALIVLRRRDGPAPVAVPWGRALSVLSILVATAAIIATAAAIPETSRPPMRRSVPRREDCWATKSPDAAAAPAGPLRACCWARSRAML